MIFISPHISDSGMSVSFQSGSAGSAGTVSQESSPQRSLNSLNSDQRSMMYNMTLCIARSVQL